MLVRSLCAFLLEGEEIAQSPLQCPLAIRLPDMLPRFIPDDVLVRLTAQRIAAVGTARIMHSVRRARLDLAAFYLLVDSGLRCGELVGLRLADANLTPVAPACAMRSSNATGSLRHRIGGR
jgi:integrase